MKRDVSQEKQDFREKQDSSGEKQDMSRDSGNLHLSSTVTHAVFKELPFNCSQLVKASL